MTVSLGANPIMVGQVTQATAVTRDATGNVLSGRVTTWVSSLAAVATVGTSSGVVGGLTIGGANITATSEGVAGLSGITVIAPTSFGNGTRIVGVNIGAGLYRSNNTGATLCYWERLNGFGSNNIIANDIGRGPRVVAISISDVGFGSSGCALWVKVTGPITASPTAPFTEGVFMVGTDIAAGTWQSNGTGTSCYWARLSNFSGNNDIIDNSFGAAPAVVTIAATDAGFEASGCGIWTKIA